MNINPNNENESESFGQFPLFEEGDIQILLHREIHFGGKFAFMLEYYENGGKGVVNDISIERIQELADFEEKSGQNLALLMLSGPDAEKIADAKAIYKSLKSIYNTQNPKNKIPRLIADLILSEEEEPKAEMEAIVAEKSASVPALIDLLKQDEFYDPLYPGYGLAPELAAQCLERIGDKKAIISLFEAIGNGDFFLDDQILKALKAIGEPAKEFLLRVVAGRPVTEDNERAAIALVQFKDDPLVASTCFKLLKDPIYQKEEAIATYLALVCQGLEEPKDREEFSAMAKDPKLSKNLRLDIQTILDNKE